MQWYIPYITDLSPCRVISNQSHYIPEVSIGVARGWFLTNAVNTFQNPRYVLITKGLKRRHIDGKCLTRMVSSVLNKSQTIFFFFVNFRSSFSVFLESAPSLSVCLLKFSFLPCSRYRWQVFAIFILECIYLQKQCWILESSLRIYDEACSFNILVNV